MNLKKLSQTLTKSSTPASRHSSERTNISLRLDLHGNVYNVRVQIVLRHPTPGRLRIMSQQRFKQKFKSELIKLWPGVGREFKACIQS